jgi:hypothetical protein
LFLRDNIDLTENAVYLLQSNKFSEFDLYKIIEILPSNWSLNKITEFIQRNLTKLNSSLRYSLTKKSLYGSQNLRMKEELMNLKNKKVILNEQR